MGNIDEEKYPYKNLPLIPSIMEELIQELFNGQLITRQTIVDEIVKYHEKRGGSKATAQDVPRSIKKALSNLKEKGVVDNPSYGYWRIIKTDSIESTNIANDIPTDVADESIGLENLDKTIDKSADKVLGSGRSAVYLYYLPLYKQNAEAVSETIWHCKIGKTDGNPLNRILNQASTALPEMPHVSLIFKTNFPSELETAIHSILTIHERKINSSPGSEWFLTSPDEVEKIVETILQTL